MKSQLQSMASFEARIIPHPALLQRARRPAPPRRIGIPLAEGTRYIDPAEIVYCQAHSNYATICLQNDEVVMISKTLKWLSGLLPLHQFVRSHSAFIVNLEYIKMVGPCDLTLKSSFKIPISRRRKAAVSEAMSMVTCGGS